MLEPIKLLQIILIFPGDSRVTVGFTYDVYFYGFHCEQELLRWRVGEGGDQKQKKQNNGRK